MRKYLANRSTHFLGKKGVLSSGCSNLQICQPSDLSYSALCSESHPPEGWRSSPGWVLFFGHRKPEFSHVGSFVSSVLDYTRPFTPNTRSFHPPSSNVFVGSRNSRTTAPSCLALCRNTRPISTDPLQPRTALGSLTSTAFQTCS